MGQKSIGICYYILHITAKQYSLFSLLLFRHFLFILQQPLPIFISPYSHYQMFSHQQPLNLHPPPLLLNQYTSNTQNPPDNHNSYELTILQHQKQGQKIEGKQSANSDEKNWRSSSGRDGQNQDYSWETEQEMDRVQSIRKIMKMSSLQDLEWEQQSSLAKKKTADSEKVFPENLSTKNLYFHKKHDLQDDQKCMTLSLSRSLTKYSRNDRSLNRNLSPTNFTSHRIKSIFKPQIQDSGPLKGKQLEGDAKLLFKGSIIKTKFMLCKDTLAFIQISFPIEDINKLKMVPLNSENEENVWLKAQINSYSHFFRIIHPNENDISLSYRIFSMIVNKKLKGFDEELKEIGHQISHHVNEEIVFNSSIFGTIYKKSQVLGRWAKRFIVIKHNGIYSYRNPHLSQSPSFHIAQDSIKYIWTRFQVLYENYLIIKIKHGVQKTQLAIPLMNFTLNLGQNWLFHLCQLLN